MKELQNLDRQNCLTLIDQHKVSTHRGYKDFRVINRIKESRRKWQVEIFCNEGEKNHIVGTEHELQSGNGKGEVGELGWGRKSRSIKSRRLTAGAWSSMRYGLSWLIKTATLLDQSLVHVTLGEKEVDGTLELGKEKRPRGITGSREALQPGENFWILTYR